MSETWWAVIGCDDKGVTVEKTGEDPEALADSVASWAQQEEDKWPELGLIYMLIAPSDVPAAVSQMEETAESDEETIRRAIELAHTKRSE